MTETLAAREAEAEESQIQGQPEPRREILSQNKKYKRLRKQLSGKVPWSQSPCDQKQSTSGDYGVQILG